MSYKHTLIVDDEPSTRKLLEINLKGMGYPVYTASSGEEAIDIFKKNSGLIGLIFMDMKMPGMNGLEATERIREMNQRVPIISYSANRGVGLQKNKFEEAALRKGTTDFLGKPFTREELKDIVEEYNKDLTS